jgi:hypothetical protein
MNSEQQRAILTVCLMAAAADNYDDDRERAAIQRVADRWAAPTSPRARRDRAREAGSRVRRFRAVDTGGESRRRTTRRSASSTPTVRRRCASASSWRASRRHWLECGVGAGACAAGERGREHPAVEQRAGRRARRGRAGEAAPTSTR